MLNRECKDHVRGTAEPGWCDLFEKECRGDGHTSDCIGLVESERDGLIIDLEFVVRLLARTKLANLSTGEQARMEAILIYLRISDQGLFKD